MKKIFHKSLLMLVLTGTLLIASCKKFVDLGGPPTQVLSEDAFKTDASATSVVLGLYVFAASQAPTMSNMTTFHTGVSADELRYNAADVNVLEFANNGLLNTNIVVNTNNTISGLNASTTLTPAVKNQLTGEAKFMRAYAYFYLTNLYGGVPLVLKDDSFYAENAVLPRSAVEQVYQQILADLIDAESKLDATYQGTFRGRVNKHAASALLARVYLYLKDYQNAEVQATKVITATGYGMPAPSVNFQNSSTEIIFQLANATGVTTFGSTYVTGATVVPTYSLADRVYTSFEVAPPAAATDLRRSNWVAPKTISGTTYYAITKYRVSSGSGNEYLVVLRLAEQYLIRAEARALQTIPNLTGAKTDLDVVRTRAGLGGLSSTLNQTQMLAAVESERVHELFGEYGHRWLDLKRTNRAEAVLAPIKSGWQPTDVLFPIPQSQILLNPSLGN
jgi:hypothetical protein